MNRKCSIVTACLLFACAGQAVGSGLWAVSDEDILIACSDVPAIKRWSGGDALLQRERLAMLVECATRIMTDANVASSRERAAAASVLMDTLLMLRDMREPAAFQVWDARESAHAAFGNKILLRLEAKRSEVRAAFSAGDFKNGEAQLREIKVAVSGKSDIWQHLSDAYGSLEKIDADFDEIAKGVKHLKYTLAIYMANEKTQPAIDSAASHLKVEAENSDQVPSSFREALTSLAGNYKQTQAQLAMAVPGYAESSEKVKKVIGNSAEIASNLKYRAKASVAVAINKLDQKALTESARSRYEQVGRCQVPGVDLTECLDNLVQLAAQTKLGR